MALITDPVDAVVAGRPDRTQLRSGRPRHRRRSLGERRRRRTGLLFVSPWLIGLSLFYLIPLVVSLAFSFTNYELVDQDDIDTKFIGLDNWRRLFEDPEVRHSALVTLRFAVIFIPLTMLVPLAVAYLLTSRHLWGSSVFRVLFYLPAIVPFVASAFVWDGFFNDTTGWLNRMLRAIGLDPPDWMQRQDVGHPGAGHHRPVGHRQRDHHLHGVAAQRARRSVRSSAHRRRQRLEDVSPCHVADDLAGDVLQPRHRPRRPRPVLHRPVRADRRKRRIRTARRSSTRCTSTGRPSPSTTAATGRHWRGRCSSSSCR